MLKVMNDKLEAEYDISVLCTDRDITNKPISEDFTDGGVALVHGV